jgi:4-aminobutyrate aminotransferase
MVINNLGRYIPKGLIKNNNIIAKKGVGCWIWDKYDTKYLDMTSGIGALSTGHSHPNVINRVKKQLDNIVHAQQNCFYSHCEQEILIEKMIEILPNNHDNIFFTNSGSEATDNAIKIARMSTNKPNIIAINGCFHGRTLAAMSITSSKISYRKGFQPLIPGVFFCNSYTKEGIDNILNNQTSPDETCAIIMEPIIGEGGIIKLPDEFVKYVRELCTKHNIKLIFDEVQCGSGRTGKWWASEHFDITPDIMTFAKGIGSGFPIGGVSANNELFNKMTKNSLGGTYNGNVISTSACIATIDTILEEKLLENAELMGLKMRRELTDMLYVKEVRQYGLFIAIEILEYIDVNIIIKMALKNNLIMISCGNNSLRIIPPLTINEKEVEIFIDKLYRTMAMI